ncbi:hypothetical protein [Paraflavitalea speifideaquila]|uniref:hypothetical protein n=1 Tax=Paraflavitalea speifideaquila TaxID=3076558 RepID=UPI0028EE23BB|nr:hypothetical protein [Paraflavitalea speifideiaquila]
MIQDRITEQPSRYRHLEQMEVTEIIQHINEEDKTVALAVEQALPQINALIARLEEKCWPVGGCFIWAPAPVAGSAYWMPVNALLRMGYRPRW